jgi:hypothetical protein
MFQFDVYDRHNMRGYFDMLQAVICKDKTYTTRIKNINIYLTY